MQSLLILAAVSSVELLTAGQRIQVAVCNMNGVSDPELSRAKTEAELVYRNIGVSIVWGGCTAFRGSWFPALTPTFVIFLRNDRPAATFGPASLEVMGEAYVDIHGGGNTAEVWVPAIRTHADLYHADPGVLLGYVLAHELGHLLLGPGHTPDGVMQAVWGEKQIDALRQRRLRFSSDSAGRIRQALAERAAPNESAPGKIVRVSR